MTKELGGSGPQKWKTSPHAWASGGGGGDSALPRRKRTNKKADRRGRRKAYGDWVKFAVPTSIRWVPPSRRLMRIRCARASSQQSVVSSSRFFSGSPASTPFRRQPTTASQTRPGSAGAGKDTFLGPPDQPARRRPR
jgi:hypothetical protein